MPESATKLHGGSKYDAQIAAKIVAEMGEGRSLRSVCDEIGFAPSTVRNWVLDDVNGFAAQYARARDLQVEALADEIRQVADDGTNDWMTVQRGGESVEVENKEVVNRSRLRVDTLKWLMSKIAPKRYGDRTSVEQSTTIHAGDTLSEMMLKLRQADNSAKPGE